MPGRPVDHVAGPTGKGNGASGSGYLVPLIEPRQIGAVPCLWRPDQHRLLAVEDPVEVEARFLMDAARGIRIVSEKQLGVYPPVRHPVPAEQASEQRPAPVEKQRAVHLDGAAVDGEGWPIADPREIRAPVLIPLREHGMLFFNDAPTTEKEFHLSPARRSR